MVANDDGLVFLAVTSDNTPGESDGYIGAYDIETGNQRWKRTDLPSPKTPSVDDETLYFATRVPETADSGDGGFYALDTDTGGTMWTRRDHDVWSPPIVTDDRIFTSNHDGTYAFDSQTGDTIWEGDGVTGLPDDVGDALSYADGTLFISDGTALDATDGSTKWQRIPENATLGNPAVNDMMVYFTRTEHIVGDDDRVMIEARSPESGAVEWEYEAEKNRWDGRPAVTDDRVFFVDSDDHGSALKVLDAETGSLTRTVRMEGTFFSDPVVGDETVYIGGQYVPESASIGWALVHAIDGQSGDRKWSYLFDSSDLETSPEDASAAGTPVVADGKLYATTYPAGATLDYKYTDYSNFFVLGPCRQFPDGIHRLPPDDGSENGDDTPPLEVCIEATPNLDSDDLESGDTVRLDASCSTGSDLTYEWDTDGDGQYDESGDSVHIEIPSCGPLTISLRTTDTNGDSDTESVSVSAN